MFYYSRVLALGEGDVFLNFASQGSANKSFVKNVKKSIYLIKMITETNRPHFVIKLWKGSYIDKISLIPEIYI